MPVVAQFVADFLGFWDWVDPDTKQGAQDAKVVYEHLSNCQDYLTYNSDETTVFPRRLAFRKSIKWLYNAAKYGIEQVKAKGAKRGQEERNSGSELRQFGTTMAQALLKPDSIGKTPATVEEAAAIRLSIALDSVHKSILTVSEVQPLLAGQLLSISVHRSSQLPSPQEGGRQLPLGIRSKPCFRHLDYRRGRQETQSLCSRGSASGSACASGAQDTPQRNRQPCRGPNRRERAPDDQEASTR